MGVILHILDEITPGSDLGAHVEELCNHGQQKMTIFQQVTITPVGPGVRRVLLFSELRESGASNKKSPKQNDCAEYEIWCDHAHSLLPENGGVLASGFERCDLGWGALDS
jgi:hypothetical protein